MTVNIIVNDNQIDGAFLVKCNLKEEGDRVLLELGSSLDGYTFEIPKDALEMVMNEDLHG